MALRQQQLAEPLQRLRLRIGDEDVLLKPQRRAHKHGGVGAKGQHRADSGTIGTDEPDDPSSCREPDLVGGQQCAIDPGGPAFGQRCLDRPQDRSLGGLRLRVGG